MCGMMALLLLSGMGCRNGGLALYDGQDSTAPLIRRYCGLQFPWSIQLDTNQVFIHLENVTWQSGNHTISMLYESVGKDAIMYAGVWVWPNFREMLL